MAQFFVVKKIGNNEGSIHAVLGTNTFLGTYVE